MSEVNIYEFAMKLELEGVDFYKNLAGKTDDEGIKNILLMLAGEEEKHYNLFKQMLEDSDIKDLPKMEVFKQSAEIFEKMKEQRENSNFKSSEIELYKQALELEKENFDFYKKEACHTKNKIHEKLFLQIAKEEEKHYKVLENIIEFIEGPDDFLANAEFYYPDR